MKPLLSLLKLSAILLFTACSGIQVAQDYDPLSDFTTLRNFSWVSVEQAPSGDPRIDSPLVDSRIRSTIEEGLQTKGLRKVDIAPQFQVQYQYLLRRALTSHGPTIGFGIGTGRRGGYGGFGIDSGGSLREYDEGALIIDFLHPVSGALLWRGTGTHAYQEHTHPHDADQEIKRLVQKILDQFPPRQ